MVLKTLLKPLFVAASTSLLLPIASAQTLEGAPVIDADVPDTLMIKVKLDDKGNEMLDEAVLIPLKVKGKLTSEGLDVDKLEADCDAATGAVTAVALDRHAFNMDAVPSDIQEQFTYADGLMDEEQINWRIWTPVGSFGNRGYYGYGHYPNYGYNNRYGNYRSNWGYYNNGRNYNYYHGHSRRRGGYGYHYYRR